MREVEAMALTEAVVKLLEASGVTELQEVEVHLPVSDARCGTTGTGSYLFIYLGLWLCGETFYVCAVWCGWVGVPDGGSEPTVMFSVYMFVFFAMYDVSVLSEGWWMCRCYPIWCCVIVCVIITWSIAVPA